MSHSSFERATVDVIFLLIMLDDVKSVTLPYLLFYFIFEQLIATSTITFFFKPLISELYPHLKMILLLLRQTTC